MLHLFSTTSVYNPHCTRTGYANIHIYLHQLEARLEILENVHVITGTTTTNQSFSPKETMLQHVK